MKSIQKMSYKELAQKVVENRCTLRTTTDLNLKRQLINDNHNMMIEMDRRFAVAGDWWKN